MKTAEITLQSSGSCRDFTPEVIATCPYCENNDWVSPTFNAEALVVAEANMLGIAFVSVDVWGDNETFYCCDCEMTSHLPSGKEWADEIYKMEKSTSEWADEQMQR